MFLNEPIMPKIFINAGKFKRIDASSQNMLVMLKFLLASSFSSVGCRSRILVLLCSSSPLETKSRVSDQYFTIQDMCKQQMIPFHSLRFHWRH